ncbi:hypothetical protein JZ751_012678 [Albula glossodonta]|uniref:Hemopexin n=1 Tax=Albula glossodonta TaxID=121402 RepID=A0A8T2N6H8_9TELE|nr:hypothetical protein JZ751_012678 [Albula glossodonta]
MRLLFCSLSICLTLALSQAAPGDSPNRCEGIDFDAITPDEKGITFFFKGEWLWRGFHGDSEPLNSSFKEMDDHHHLGHDDKVFSYFNHTLETGFPKDIQELFPGIPTHLDAAVECPKGEYEVYHFDLKTQAVKKRHWAHLPNCTAAYRWLERYYCFHGHQFTKFHPVTGSVVGNYPKDARSYFMRCPKFGNVNDDGLFYYCKCQYYMRLDTQRDGWHAFPISNVWKEVGGDLDSVFSYEGKLYMIKGDQVYIYKTAAHYTLIEGYPKTLKEELGIEGPVDAAFVCGEYPIVHVVKGQSMLDIDLSATPRTVLKEWRLPFPKIDAGMCSADGVRVFVGAEYFHYETPMLLALSRIRPQPHKISLEMLGCDH